MKTARSFVAGLPQLDVFTLSEDWALATSLENHWQIQSDSMGLKPSDWLDSQGDRMYGAVLGLSTWFDFGNVLREDDVFTAETEFLSVRKPHALSSTRFVVNGQVKAEVRLLTSLIKRHSKGSNKKFAKVRDVWQADDLDGDIVDAALERHHQMKSHEALVSPAMDYEVNRIQDFNTADFLYFKNYVRISKAAEWRQNRGNPPRLNKFRECWYFGNVEDGDTLHAAVGRSGDACTTTLSQGDRRVFLSISEAPEVEITQR